MAQRKTYRVRQIPAYVEQTRLPHLLHRAIEYRGPITGIRIFSFATSLAYTDNVRTKEATIMFEETPLSLPDGKDEWIISRDSTDLPYNLIIDAHFQGFTVFNDVHPADHVYDYIAISGLASHAFGSWRQRDEASTFMWLRDYLPKTIIGARSIIYGYDTRILDSRSFQTIQDLADSLLSKMRSAEFSAPSSRPLVFIAHSLGGIILKQAIASMANSGVAERHMLLKVRKAVLFGVPNCGMMVSHLLPMVNDQPNKDMLELLDKGSPYLSELNSQFGRLCHRHEICLISAVETEMTRIPKRDDSGQWKREGNLEILVSRESAIQAGSKAVLPINRDHSSLVKFAEGDPDLLAVMQYLQHSKQHLLDGQILSVRSPSFGNIREVYQDPAEAAEKVVEDPEVISEAVGILRGLLPKTISDMQNSLFMDITERRFREVDSAHDHTFSWIYDNTTLRMTDWLENGSGLYWITGKPGSGKSTALKYICGHLPPSLVSSKSDVTIKFFFFHRGSHLQKSFEGLLRSILYQLSVSSKSIAQMILPHYLRNRNSDQIWSLDQLQHVYDSILETRDPQFVGSLSGEMFSLWADHTLKRPKIRRIEVLRAALEKVSDLEAELPRVTLFLDALDEYDGSIHRIISFVNSTIKVKPGPSLRFRVCFSSRPWNAFSDAFSDSLGFSMQNHTHQDLADYVVDSMQASKRIDGMMKSVNGQTRLLATDLKTQVLGRANGVFLWVKLVLQDLVEAAADGATAQELLKVLASLPNELDDLYRKLLGRIDPKHRKETYYMLETLLRAPRILKLYQFWPTVQCAPLEAIDTCVAVMEEATSDLEVDTEAICRRIRSRCGGLIEIVNEERKAQASVQLMHQTVKDFLSRPSFQRTLMSPETVFTTANGYSALYRCYLASLQLYVRTIWNANEQPDPQTEMLSDLIFVAHEAELTTGRTERALLDGIADSVFEVGFRVLQKTTMEQQRLVYPIPRLFPVHSKFSFAVFADLRLYMKDVLDDCKVSPTIGGHLLYTVADALFYRLVMGDTEPAFDYNSMVQLLLKYGADINVVLDGVTPFQSLYRCLEPHHKDCDSMAEIKEQIANIATTLIEHGADPSVDVYRESDEKFPARWSSKAIHVPISATLFKALLKAGLDANCCDGRGRTPLDCTVSKRQSHTWITECAKVLTDKGGKFSTADEEEEEVYTVVPEALLPSKDIQNDTTGSGPPTTPETSVAVSLQNVLNGPSVDIPSTESTGTISLALSDKLVEQSISSAEGRNPQSERSATIEHSEIADPVINDQGTPQLECLLHEPKRKSSSTYSFRVLRDSRRKQVALSVSGEGELEHNTEDTIGS